MSAPRAYDPIARVHSTDAVGTTVRLRGWVLRARSSGGILFLIVRDRTGATQVTARKDAVGAGRFADAEKLQVEGVVEVLGTVASDPRAPGGREVRAEGIEVHHAGEPFPIFQDQTEEFLLDKRHLAIRSQDLVAMVRVKAELLGAFRRFL
ncbi:MAG TPA: OB-fold nucleic acid binding domain-containing protein, partial [Thermoplasmata archaeon]|nr:OB-fold nucleic acid binding domain-containing protein [Thermoplasmata archaeon]